MVIQQYYGTLEIYRGNMIELRRIASAQALASPFEVGPGPVFSERQEPGPAPWSRPS